MLAGTWSLIFGAPHLYWALGGRAGLGHQAGAADAALSQPWFATYNLTVAGLTVAGALVALAVIRGLIEGRLRRWLRIAVGSVGVVLLLRGAVGLVLLGAGLLGGTSDPATPPVLLLIEPWIVLGGVVQMGMARSLRPWEEGWDRAADRRHWPGSH